MVHGMNLVFKLSSLHFIFKGLMLHPCDTDHQLPMDSLQYKLHTRFEAFEMHMELLTN